MKILVTGLCTLHWGRLEYGNVGNYYIMEPLFRNLHRVFPGATIVTTFQMTEDFCKRENVNCLPMELYYSWTEKDVSLALREYATAELYHQTGVLIEPTPYIEHVYSSDLVLDVSGEMWGDKANPVGENRMLVNLLKLRVAQLLKKPTVLFAGSVGPFTDLTTAALAKITFEAYDLVTNREHETTKMIAGYGFKTKHIKEYPCPSFLFEPAKEKEIQEILKKEMLTENHKPTIGMVVCGFNMKQAPYDKWPRDDEEYTEFARAVEYMINVLGARVVLMSHSNGFDLPPEFRLKPGRDYPIVKQLQQVVIKRGILKDSKDLICIDHAYIPAETKAIIGTFDMFFTGRMHASVAAVSQNVPTVCIMHGQGSKSTKIIGFFSILGLPELICEPESEDMIKKIDYCFNHRAIIRKHLEKVIPTIKTEAMEGFHALKVLVEAKENE